ncbi:MAG: isoaspartyl peptidase/L-asparaginase [bacterium]
MKRTWNHQTLPLALCLGVGLLIAGCGEPIHERAAALPTLAGEQVVEWPLVVTHGGAGSPPDWMPDCQAAADSGLTALQLHATALATAVRSTMVLEDIPRFNAGTGANIRLDGRTIQMDAAVMTSAGEFAAVAVIERVRNPVAVARAVLDTPHRLLAGEGATRFAHRAGFADLVPTCPEAEAKYRVRIERLLAGEAGGGYDTFDWRAYWNYETEPPISQQIQDEPDLPEISDTVGSVVRDANGNFAATLSTGGTSITLNGRVGDVPIYGCGCFAGPAGAVACTGFGEEIIRHAMARGVYDLLAQGFSARDAVQQSCAGFPPEYSLGLIAVGKSGWGVAANRDMAYGIATADISDDTAGSFAH